MTEAITVVIAEDHPLFRKGLSDALSVDASFRIVGEAADGEQALEMLRRHRPRVALLDLDMPKLSGLAVAEAVRQEHLGGVVVMLTMFKDAAMLRRALDLGARVRPQGQRAHRLWRVSHLARRVARTSAPHCRASFVTRRAITAAELAAVAALTPAERRVLRLIAQGLTSGGIAERLGISAKTVENHRLHICDKLELHGPQALLRYALERKALLD